MSAATAAIELSVEGLTMRLSFSYQHPEFSAPLADHQICGSALPEELGRADDLVMQLATESGPALLQVFEKSQSTVLQTWALLKQKQIAALQSANPTGGAA